MNIPSIAVPFAEPHAYYCSGIRMALLSDDYNYAYMLSECKEFALDNTQKSIHNKKTKAVCLSELRLAVANLDSKQWTKHGLKTEGAANSIALINLFEDALGIDKSAIFQATKSVIIFKGSPIWFLAPPLLSLYALVVRQGRKYTPGDSITQALDKFKNDLSNISSARKSIDYILAYGIEEIFGTNQQENWPLRANVHYNGGICAFSVGAMRNCCPHWYKHWKTGLYERIYLFFRDIFS
jgi:hypothetical protein